jgi:hypothetical protein
LKRVLLLWIETKRITLLLIIDTLAKVIVKWPVWWTMRFIIVSSPCSTILTFPMHIKCSILTLV